MNGNATTPVSGERETAWSPPVLSLPKGGGAIRGIGEKFAANPVTGTGSMTVPIATSPGRSGFGPQLSLSYDSGSGNGPFGLGWTLSTPTITRRMDKGLPQYRDAEESDVYILSGAEDLVPVLQSDGARFKDDTTTPGYIIHRYRPRVEGLFARIERWTNIDTGEIHWRSISRDNVTTLYGKDNNSRIFDPNDPMPSHPTRVFSWLICQSYDDKGNAIAYNYAEENDDNVGLTKPNERNRVRTANRYLKRVQYGNRTPNRDAITWQAIDPAQLPNDTWMFEVVFDYGEGHYSEDAPDAQGRVLVQAQIDSQPGSSWPVRQDPFSTYRASFEVRSYRLCRRVLMFHHFPVELGINDCLVRSTEFSYSESRIASFISSVTQSGFMRQPTQDQLNLYLKKSLPQLEFEYSKVPTPKQLAMQPIRELDEESVSNLPVGLDGVVYQWVDLDGEGVPGILTEQADGWFYKRNLSANNHVSENGHELTVARFGPVELVASKPNTGLAAGSQFLDLAGDGQVDLAQMGGIAPGFYERADDAGWETFRPFPSWPNINPSDPNLKFVDLTGDGHTDILITEGDALTWYPSLAEEGFGPSLRVSIPLDEEKGPRLVFSNDEQSIYLADLSGDGLSDLVRIRQSEVVYWPNLGYGRFGAKVTMDHAPWFDSPDLFDQRRIRLADTDGSGTTDILYLRSDSVQIYFNQSGNGWSQAVALPQIPSIDNISSVQALDLLGNATACLVWSSPLPGDASRPMRYVDLMGGQKPHLMVGMKNNIGAETRVEYATSTKFYLADKTAGKPWVTRLPFPVHVVERVETLDRINRNHFVARYAYHHGFYDGGEREFRGFGMVEQWDTESFAALSDSHTLPYATNIDSASHVPPVYIKTWFHTGAFDAEGRISKQFEKEYYREGDPSFGQPALTDQQLAAMMLRDTELPTDKLMPDGTRVPYSLSAEEAREACRSLKGMILRIETYAQDGAEESDRPYTVSERNYTVELLQPRNGVRHAVFFTHVRESIDFHYERKLFDVTGEKVADPRVTHNLTLNVNNYGNILRSADVAYGRRFKDPALSPNDQRKQERTHITFVENLYTNPILESGDYRTPLPCESRTYELLKVRPSSKVQGVTNIFRFDELNDQIASVNNDAATLPYQEWNADEDALTAPRRRLIKRLRTLFRKNDISGPLPLADLESLALPYEAYKLAFTPELVTDIFKRDVNGVEENLVSDQTALLGKKVDGGYVHSEEDANWWIPSGQIFYSPNETNGAAQELGFARQHFFQPRRFRDPFGHSTTIDYAYDLLLKESRDPFGNTVSAENDFRALAPRLLTDPNGNRSFAKFDALGLVVATAVRGEVTEDLGDSVDDFTDDDANPTLEQLQSFMTDPQANASASLKSATSRIIYDVDRYRRESEPPYAATLIRETHVSDPAPPDGLKIQVSFSYSDGFGREIQKKIQAEPGRLDPGDKNSPVINPRWVGSGWTIFNNKGQPVRQYEPFFDDTHDFKFARIVGVSPVLFYDPVERVIATLHPNHSWEKVVFDPWMQTTYDVNDTLLNDDGSTDPKSDKDVKGFFSRLPDADYIPTWYEQRIALAANDPERVAAEQAAVHRQTPTVAHLDALGRTFLTIAHNRFGRNGAIVEEKYPTRVELDIEGNQRAVRDAVVKNNDTHGRLVMRYDYDMLGNRIHQASMEAGERWMLNDVAGMPIRAWDSRGFTRRIIYDELRRPTGLFVTENNVERLAERTVYGESQGAANNHRTRVFKVFDGAGEATSEEYDFKGNLLRGRRDILPDYKGDVDWRQNLTPNDGTFTSSTTYDALNRLTAVTTPDGSVYRPTYNEANLLDRVEVNLRGAATATPFVTNIDYNAKGQRVLIHYANGAETTYRYDDQTFHLVHLRTTRAPGQNGQFSQIFKNATTVQDLRFTYDPAGNITRIEDAALPTILHNGEQVEPVCDYSYDAVYRLIEARGREHIGQTAFDFAPPNGNRRDFPFFGSRANPNDPQAMRNYTERYEYDEAGNCKLARHNFNGGGWNRAYDYEEASLLEPAKVSNRLTRSTAGGFIETYTYRDAQGADVHGSMTAINSMKMTWDFEDQLQHVDLGGGGVAYYVYDADGQRVRKVIETQNGTRKEERIYLGDYEIYREYNGGGAGVKLERETVHVMDDKRRVALVETKTIENGNAIIAPEPLQRYQIGNHLESVSLELDKISNLISYEEYHPYGTTSYQATAKQIQASKRYRYTSRERDEESGLGYHSARYYIPWMGRWLSTDPGGLRDGLNVYAYTKGSPLIHTDWTGLDAKSDEESLKAGAQESETFRTLVESAVKDYGGSSGLSTKDVLTIINLESSGKPGHVTGKYRGLLQLSRKDDYDSKAVEKARKARFTKTAEDKAFKWNDKKILVPKTNIRYGTLVIALRVQEAKESIARKGELEKEKTALEEEAKALEQKDTDLRKELKTLNEKKNRAADEKKRQAELRTAIGDIPGKRIDIKNKQAFNKELLKQATAVEAGNKKLEDFMKKNPVAAAYLLHQQGLAGLRNILDNPTKALDAEAKKNITESSRSSVKTNQDFVDFWVKRFQLATSFVK